MASTRGTSNRRFVDNCQPGVATLLCTLLALTLAAYGAGSSTARTVPSQPSATPKLQVTSVAGVPLDTQLGGKTVYMTTAGRSGTQSPGCLLALNAQTGATRWSFCPQGTAGAPAVADGVVYYAPEDGNIYALDAAAGKQIWSHSTGSGIGSAPAVVDGAVYVTCDDGTVHALRASDGKLSWEYKAGDATFASPIVA